MRQPYEYDTSKDYVHVPKESLYYSLYGVRDILKVPTSPLDFLNIYLSEISFTLPIWWMQSMQTQKKILRAC